MIVNLEVKKIETRINKAIESCKRMEHMPVAIQYFSLGMKRISFLMNDLITPYYNNIFQNCRTNLFNKYKQISKTDVDFLLEFKNIMDKNEHI